MQRTIPSYLLWCALFCAPAFAVDLPPPEAPTTPAPTAALPQPNDQEILLARSTVDDKVNGDSVIGHRMRRLAEQPPDASYLHPYEPVLDKGVSVLPAPQNVPAGVKHLSVNEAIMLALRSNPAVKTAELQRVLDKFSMETRIHDRYAVRWSPLVLGSTLTHGGTGPSWSAASGASVTGMTGTNVGIAYTNSLQGGPGATTLTVSQPLLQNFGRDFNQIIYDDAITNEKVARLNFKNSVITVVVNVISNYRALVQAYENLALSKQSLASQEQSVDQTRLQVKTGQMAPSDLVQQQANLESTRLSVVQQQNSLRDAYQTFLTALGLTPNANIVIDQKIYVGNKQETVPTKAQSIAIGLKNNIAYQSALLQLQITERQLISAENSQKASLNVTGTAVLSGGADQSTTQPNVGITLSVPIDNVDLQSQVVSAKVAIENAKLNLEQTKENLIRQVADDWETIQNQYQQIHISEVAVQMQQQTLNNTKLQLKYGKASVFEVNTLETSLLQQQLALVSTEIAYLNAVTTLNQTLGLTLDMRHVKLRY